jgi:hypothetical protein
MMQQKVQQYKSISTNGAEIGDAWGIIAGQKEVKRRWDLPQRHRDTETQRHREGEAKSTRVQKYKGTSSERFVAAQNLAFGQEIRGDKKP